MKTELYDYGRGKPLELGEESNAAFMCRDRSHASCHRRYMVETLANKGIKTIALIWTANCLPPQAPTQGWYQADNCQSRMGFSSARSAILPIPFAFISSISEVSGLFSDLK